LTDSQRNEGESGADPFGGRGRTDGRTDDVHPAVMLCCCDTVCGILTPFLLSTSDDLFIYYYCACVAVRTPTWALSDRDSNKKQRECERGWKKKTERERDREKEREREESSVLE